jgi:hypothetical protein
LQAVGLTTGTVTAFAVLCQFSGEVIDSDPIWGSLVPVGSAVNIEYVDPNVCM